MTQGAQQVMQRMVACLVVVLVSTGAAGAGDDWPTWRHDVNRSGASDQELPSKLSLMWKRELARPRPSFPNQPRMCADRCYEPVAADDLLFVPSMVEDSVTAYRAEDGAIAWKYMTGGPVRFAPTYWEGKVYFGSDDGHVYCVAASDGRLIWRKRGVADDRADWRFFGNERCISRWPVRGAPIIHGGTLYFGSGVWPSEGVYVFAVDADTGETKWVNKHIGLIENGFNDHGRQYPAGLPPLGYFSVIKGKLVMTSGRAFPAFMDLETGKLDPYTSGYGKFQDYPKGYWYATGIGDYFFCAGHTYGLAARVLEGRPPEWVTEEEYRQYAGMSQEQLSKLLDAGAFVTKKEAGAVYINTGPPPGITPVGFGHRHITPNEQYFIEHFHKVHVDPENRGRDVGVFRERVLTDDRVYFSAVSDASSTRRDRGSLTRTVDRYDRIVAQDLSEAGWRIVRAYGPGFFPPGWQGGGRSKLIHWRYKYFEEEWSLDCALKVHIKSGSRLYAGGRDTVAAIEIPEEGRGPRIVWRHEISGTPERMISSCGELFVVTREGRVYCFGRQGGQRRNYEHEVQFGEETDEWTDRASLYLSDQPDPVRGYCLVYGWHSGRLAEEIARQSDLQVVVLERDADVVEAARRRLAEKNINGYRIHVITRGPGGLKLPPHFAQLIVSERPLGAGELPVEDLLEQITCALHPYCGTAYFAVSNEQLEAIERYIDGRQDGGYEVAEEQDVCRISRVSPAEGSAIWTHEAADAANTFATHDRHVKPPLGVLWFSGSIDRYFLPPWDYTHNRNPYPVVCSGRMYILVANRVYAGDIYTGAYLWEKALPETAKTKRRMQYHRKFSRPWYDNIVAQEDVVYVFEDHTCYILDAATGDVEGELPLPTRTGGNGDASWREIRIDDGKLFANVGTDIVRMDGQSGEVMWRHSGTKKWVAFAVAEGTVYCVDYYPPLSVANQREAGKEAVLYALDADDGDMLWSQRLSVPEVSEKEHTAAAREFKASAATLKPLVACNAMHGIVIAIVNRNRMRALKGATGEPLWQKEIRRPRPNSTLFELEPPVVLDDTLITDTGEILDVTTGNTLYRDIFHGKRGCGRAVANQHVLTYRDAHEAIVNLDEKTKQYVQCIRSGCTNAMLPVGGILTAFDTAHGCVCNWPLFLSHALYHMPQADSFEPSGMCVVEYEQFAEEIPADVAAYLVRGGTVAERGRGLILDSDWQTSAYALKEAETDLQKVEFEFIMQSAPGKSKPGRFTNGFFVFGPSKAPESLVTCGIYYGREQLVITGNWVEDAAMEHAFLAEKPYTISVQVDLEAGIVTVRVGDDELTAKITGDIAAIRYYGYRADNTATLFSGIRLK